MQSLWGSFCRWNRLSHLINLLASEFATDLCFWLWLMTLNYVNNPKPAVTINLCHLVVQYTLFGFSVEQFEMEGRGPSFVRDGKLVIRQEVYKYKFLRNECKYLSCTAGVTWRKLKKDVLHFFLFCLFLHDTHVILLVPFTTTKGQIYSSNYPLGPKPTQLTRIVTDRLIELLKFLS